MVQEPNLRILVRAPRLSSVVEPVLPKPEAGVTVGVGLGGIEGCRFLPGKVLGAVSVGGGNPCSRVDDKLR